MPSRVSIVLPSIWPDSRMQVGESLPSINTEHAPHSPLSHPCLTLHNRLRRRTASSDSLGVQFRVVSVPLSLSCISISLLASLFDSTICQDSGYLYAVFCTSQIVAVFGVCSVFDCCIDCFCHFGAD